MSSHDDLILDEGAYYSEINGFQVPQNICHRFRSKVTTDLLANRDKVDRDKEELLYRNIRQTTPIYRRSQSTVSLSDPNYTQISNDLRSLVCRGHPVQRASHSKTVHNAEVFRPPSNDENSSASHRRKKDWLAKWTEANIIRDRLYKDIAEATKKPNQ